MHTLPAEESLPQLAVTGDKGRLAKLGWILFDASKAPYYSLIPLFVFYPYFTTSVIGDPVRGQSILGYLGAIAAVALALGAPMLGAIADQGGRRKPWIAACVVLGSASMGLLWFAEPRTNSLAWILIAMLLANLAVEYAGVFGNALLAGLADKRGVGTISGLGMMASNIANFAGLTFFLIAWAWNPTPLFGLDKSTFQPERAAGLLAAAMFLIGSAPLFICTPDAPPKPISKLAAIAAGLASLRTTLRSIRSYENVVRFLLARMIFNEGFIALMLFSGVFAAGILRWNSTMLVLSGLLNSILASLASIFAAFLTVHIGARRSTMFFVLLCLFANLLMLSIGPETALFLHFPRGLASPGELFPTIPDKMFLMSSALVAMSVSAGYATSRTLMAELSPPEKLSEFFGLFALSGNVTSFAAPLLIGVLTSVFQSQKAGVPVGAVFLLVGLWLLTRVGRANSEDLNHASQRV